MCHFPSVFKSYLIYSGQLICIWLRIASSFDNWQKHATHSSPGQLKVQTKNSQYLACWSVCDDRHKSNVGQIHFNLRVTRNDTSQIRRGVLLRLCQCYSRVCVVRLLVGQILTLHMPDRVGCGRTRNVFMFKAVSQLQARMLKENNQK